MPGCRGHRETSCSSWFCAGSWRILPSCSISWRTWPEKVPGIPLIHGRFQFSQRTKPMTAGRRRGLCDDSYKNVQEPRHKTAKMAAELLIAPQRPLRPMFLLENCQHTIFSVSAVGVSLAACLSHDTQRNRTSLYRRGKRVDWVRHHWTFSHNNLYVCKSRHRSTKTHQKINIISSESARLDLRSPTGKLTEKVKKRRKPSTQKNRKPGWMKEF